MTVRQPSDQTAEAYPASANAHLNHGGRRRKTFSLATYKHHSYGDYVATIRKYGTTDSYSTEVVRDVSCFLTQIAHLLLSG